MGYSASWRMFMSAKGAGAALDQSDDNIERKSNEGVEINPSEALFQSLFDDMTRAASTNAVQLATFKKGWRKRA
jgi:hypothetical protein